MVVGPQPLVVEGLERTEKIVVSPDRVDGRRALLVRPVDPHGRSGLLRRVPADDLANVSVERSACVFGAHAVLPFRLTMKRSTCAAGGGVVARLSTTSASAEAAKMIVTGIMPQTR